MVAAVSAELAKTTERERTRERARERERERERGRGQVLVSASEPWRASESNQAQSERGRHRGDAETGRE
jgi:hypothetical protein